MKTKFFCTMRASVVLGTALILIMGGCQDDLNDHPLAFEEESSKKLEILEGTLMFETFNDYDEFFNKPEKFEIPKFDNAKLFFFEEAGGVKENLRTSSDATEFLEDLEDTQLLEI
ncbi:hypothetical protein P872_02590 [Rhodonellum psychrophilum GCM71 = DSM 17998]|uniref:Uncharacterized protein n=2 Tax=Rhodonellum TaxID=336827 RepID=U5C459_9BACT|nr:MULTISPECIES: hypothetical protein [Rhodonellum]ERM83706.1 hypothetical protein P872_02590 [Rhodonellum psychrophilum GCM71 = DSM 17998]SDY90116.1 hypothetical protein SAMN05444412_103327 [Rhodonellum ikkaensis]